MRRLCTIIIAATVIFVCAKNDDTAIAGPPHILPLWKKSDSSTISPVNTAWSTEIGTPEAADDADEIEIESHQWKNDAAQDTVGYRKSYVVVQNADGNESTIPMLYQMVSGTERGAGRISFTASLADGAQVILPVGIVGFGTVYVSDDDDYAVFSFTSAGAVTLQDTAGSTSTTEDNDTTLNIFDDGSGIGIENELGSTKVVIVDITCYLP